MSSKLMYVVGARPNFMKVAPILRAVRARQPDCRQFLVHTGQHFAMRMSNVWDGRATERIADLLVSTGGA